MPKQGEASLLLRIKQTGQEALSKTGELLTNIGKVGAAAFTAIAGVATAAISAYRDQEKATNALNQAMVQQGIFSKSLSQEYQAMASALQKTTTYGDEAIVSAQAQLQQFIGNNKITKELTQSVLDFATAQGMDLNSAAQAIGKSIGTNTNALARYGVEVDANATMAEKLAAVTEGLNQKFGGQAAAAASGLGALEQLKNAAGDVLEVIGQRLAPIISYLAQQLTGFAEAAQQNQTVLDGMANAILYIAKAGVIAKTAIESVIEVISGGLATVLGSITQAMDGNFAMAWETLKSGSESAVEQVKANYEGMHAQLSALDAAATSRRDEERLAELEKLSAQNAAIVERQIASKEQEVMLEQQKEAQKEAIRIQKEAERKAREDTTWTARSQEELNKLILQEQAKANVQLQAQIARINQQIANEQNATARYQLELEKRKLLDAAYEQERQKNLTAMEKFDEAINSQRVTAASNTFSRMAQMQNSKNKELVAIGKAAALVNIGIDTARGAIAAYASLAPIPFVGPVLGAAAAAAIIAYGAEQASTVSGIALAEGGIVRARPGGIQATIGEGGSDEAVIPLDDDRASGMLGNKIMITVYGGLLGDEYQAREFAVAVDRELLRLRQANQSLAFDEGAV